MNLKERIEKLIAAIAKDVYEKETIFKLAILAMLAGESIFLLGKPGIAKSLVARRMKYAFKNGQIFEYLMNRFSTPEEIFGPISIEDLQKGKYRRIIDQYLPTADIAFLDEIWKAGPSIQNTLLTIINEKLFRNAGQDVKVPLKLLISASNELPTPGQGLEALFDRFIIRFIGVGLVSEDNFNDMINSSTSLAVEVDPNLQVAPEEYQAWLKEIGSVQLSQSTFSFIHRFRKALHIATNGEAYISDRRWKKIAHLMKASAYYNGRFETDKADWLVIPYCIWDDEIQEKDYTKLFNEIYVEALSYEIMERKKMLEQDLEQIIKALEEVETNKIKTSIYTNPFNGLLKGNYYRILWNNVEFPIAFIADNDFKRICAYPKSEHPVKIYYGKNLSEMANTLKITARFQSEAEFVNVEHHEVFLLEIQSETTVIKEIEKLNVQMNDIEYQINNLNNEIMFEKNRLEKQACIFFDEQYKLSLQKAFADEETTIYDELER